MDKDSKLTVGLYTWCYDNGRTNYGQILQCYATQTLFEEIGLKVQLIRYRKLEENESPPALQCDRVEYEKQYRINVVEGYIDDRVRSILAFISNNINCGPICYTEDELRKSVEGCDVLVCGSDQLWNPKYYHSSICLFSWDRTDRKRISFATSGANDDSDDDKKSVVRLELY